MTEPATDYRVSLSVVASDDHGASHVCAVVSAPYCDLAATPAAIEQAVKKLLAALNDA